MVLKSNAKLTPQEQILKTNIINTIKDQGFKINPHVRPSSNTKLVYKKIQQTATKEQIQNNKKFLKEFFSTAKEFSKDGSEINPENISLELKLVLPDTLESKLFRWWNLIWWSVPYQRPYGRLIRFLLWDKTHDSPFGLISLQSPVLNMGIRDKALEIPKEELDYWVNMSMNAQRVGALPPYNDLIGGKMVALSLTANEIRDVYRNKYKNTITLLEKRKLKSDLLFITTTSAFGKSSMYDRLRYKNKLVAESLGYTKGSGTFHFTDSISKEIYEFLEGKGINTKTTFGFGPSRKIRLIESALNYLGLQNYHYHGIKREFYIFPLVHNLHDVIHKGKKPKWIDRSFNELVDFWKERWGIPRSQRNPKWRDFKSRNFFYESKIKDRILNMSYDIIKPRLELPAGLIEELLQKNEKVGSNLLKSIEEIQKHKKTIRDWLENNDYLDLVTNLPDVEIPTSCGIDGSFVVEHMLSSSLVACAAVAIEGFTPPSETKHWPLKYDSLVEVESHETEINTMIRGLMKIMETTLAINAPHDVILLDGSVASQIIHMNQAMSKAYDKNKSKILGDKLKEDYENFLQCFDAILKNSDSRIWASLPKFTTRSEIGFQYDKVNGWPEKQDDRSVLTALLKPGEYTKPIRLTDTSKDNWHLTQHEDPALQKTNDDIIKSLNNYLVFYYKPKEFTPALRIEIAESVGSDDTKLATIMKSLHYQFASYAIMEPYPLYMADRMVKNLSGAIPALRQAALQKVAGKSDAELQQILLFTRL